MANIEPIKENIEKDLNLAPDTKTATEQIQPGFGIEKEAQTESEKTPEARPVEARPATPKELPTVAPKTSTAKTAPPTPLTEEIAAVEKIMAENLSEVYAKMTPEQQVVFKHEGEVAAVKIVGLLSQVKIKVREIAQIIIKWLRTIPGVSRFFVEQEAKIKADKLLEIHRRKTGGE